MDQVTVIARTHWFNGWFLRLLSTPYAVTDSAEHRIRWGAASTVPVAAEDDASIGVAVRYFDRGSLMGLEKVQLDAGLDHGTKLGFRNGFWNHDPFRLVRAAVRTD